MTGLGGAKREFRREFDDWWKDTQRAGRGTVSAHGDTLGERLSNAEANLQALELTPVSLLTTAIGATFRLLADLFAGPRQEQQIPLESEGVFLIRVISTPAIQEDLAGQPVIRPPSVASKVVEVQKMDSTVDEALAEPEVQLVELQAQIDIAREAGNQAKADYLTNLLLVAQRRLSGPVQDLLEERHALKLKELEQFRHDCPSLSDYSRRREVELLEDQIANASAHEKQRSAGATGLGPAQHLNATLISEVTGQQYPLILTAGPMAPESGLQRWMLSDVTNRDGEAYIGHGSSALAAFTSALDKFGAAAAYGRGRIGVRSAGLDLAGAPATIYTDSAPADGALARKRIDDLVEVLAALGLIVASAGTAGALVGAAVAAARLIERWRAGHLRLDGESLSDALSVLGGLGAGAGVLAGLRVQKFGEVFAVIKEGQATESEIAAAAQALATAEKIAHGVELANEAINYAGLLWGEVSFVDQMISIGEQENSGAISHTDARRQRAAAVSSAVQNHALFIAANVLKARQQARANEPAKAGGKGPGADQPGGAREREGGGARDEKAAGASDKASERALDERAAAATGQAPRALDERPATLEEMRTAVPADLRDQVRIDPGLHGDHVEVRYTLDEATGLIRDIDIVCGPEARLDSIALHVDTVRTMQKFQGLSGRVRQALSWVAELVGVDTLSPEKNPQGFRAALEIRKLPRAIEAQLKRMAAMEPQARAQAEAELLHLELQLEQHLRTLDIQPGGDSAGAVAAKGLSKAKREQYAKLQESLRPLEAGSDAHRALRWEMYELIGGDLPRASWDRIYSANMERANKANRAVAAEKRRLGWPQDEYTIADLGHGDMRRLDLADPKRRKGAEIKLYATGEIYASADMLDEVRRDAKLVRRGWEISWILIDTEPSGPLVAALQKAGIIVEYRHRVRGNTTVLVSRVLPPTR